MALVELCNLDSLVKINPCHEDNELLEAIQCNLSLKDPMQLFLPPVGNPLNMLKQYSVSDSGRPIKFDFQHGTTTLGFVYQGGVLLAVDSRATGGSYIGSQRMKKIVEINDYMLGTLAGGAADCVYWDRVLSKQCRIYELRNRERISVAAASKLMANMIYSYKGMGLSMGMMLAGYDKRGASLYYIDSEGTRTQGKVFSVGSGSVYAYGVLDSGYKWDLTDEEAYELGRNSIMHATHRDAYSGGIIRVYHITSEGWKNISNQDSSDLYYSHSSKNM